MERKVKKMMADLQFIMNHGQISVDFMDLGYKRMLFSALGVRKRLWVSRATLKLNTTLQF
ncbi:hypothetical protein ABE201_28470 [Bacillus mycoides]|uniref:hypothetical protein n=1 Tax=Bacillus mycoides TaxID=1405 RepID=UPI000B4A9509|nr:hypothetical protein [Bacillus mycoides]MBG9721853.1 hypothetical protein [Bacillus mycoides]